MKVGEWTEAELHTLVRMRQEGKSFGTIADTLGRTRCAAIGKSHREGLCTTPDKRKLRDHIAALERKLTKARQRLGEALEADL